MQQSYTLSFQFRLAMAMFSALFWVLGWIPILNILTNFVYWVIWVVIFFFRYLPIIKRIAKAGVAIGRFYVKVGIVSAFCAVMGAIPIVCWFPWQCLANWYTNREMSKLAEKVNFEQLAKDASSVQKGWNRMNREFRTRGRTGASAPSVAPTEEELAPPENPAETKGKGKGVQKQNQILENEGNDEENDEWEFENVSEPQENPTLETPMLENAYLALKNKPDKSREDLSQLEYAKKILETGSISVADRNNPVYVAAYEEYLKQKTQSRAMNETEQTSQTSEKTRPSDEPIDEVGAMIPPNKPR